MDEVEARMRATFALRAFVVAMQREVLRRQHPRDSPEKIEIRLRAWVLRPGPVS